MNISNVQNHISNVDISFEKWMKPSLDFDLWFLKFASLSDVLFLLDFGFRIYFSFRLFFKYWDAGSIRLPEVDVRRHKEVKNPFKMSKGRMIILLFTNPLVGAFLLGLISLWIVSLASSVYTPLYKEYINGCVPWYGNGTFITSNVYSMAYNFAYQEGSSSLVKGIENFDDKRTTMCSSLYSESATKQNNDMLQIDSLSKSLEATGIHMVRLDRCLDTDRLDALFRQACCGQMGYEECSDSVIGGAINMTTTNITNVNGRYICPMKSTADPDILIPYTEPGKYKRSQNI